MFQFGKAESTAEMHRFLFLNQNKNKNLGHMFGIWQVKSNLYINFHKTLNGSSTG